MSLKKFIQGIFGTDEDRPAPGGKRPDTNAPRGAWEKIIEQANRLDESGEPEKALALLDDALRDDPSNAARYYGAKAFIFGHLEKYEQVLECQNKIIELDGDSHESSDYGYTRSNHLIDRGDTYAQLGDYEAAISDFNSALKIRPGDTLAIASRGNAYYALGELDKALEDFNFCLAQDHDSWSDYLDRGKVYAKLGEWQRAADDYTKAIALTEDSEYGVMGHFERGEIYLELGDYQAAVDDFSAELEEHPADPEIYRQRAAAYRRLGRTDLAAADDEKADYYQAQPDADEFDDDQRFAPPSIGI